MRESDFAKEVKASFEAQGHFYLKIPDAIPAPAVNDENGQRVFSRPRFIPPKPFDAMAVWRGVPIAMEYKQHKSETGGFSFDRLAPHQKKHLSAFKESGGLALIIINVRITRQTNEAYVIPIEKWKLLERSYLPDRKSLPAAKLKEMEKLAWIKQGLKYIWDIESYLTKYHEDMARIETF